MKIVTSRDITAELYRQGYSARSWALEHGFKERTVQRCIERHAPDSNRKLKGVVYKEILRRLSETLGCDLLEEQNE